MHTCKPYHCVQQRAPSATLTILHRFMTSRQGMGVTGGTPLGFDVGTPAGEPGGTLAGLDVVRVGAWGQ